MINLNAINFFLCLTVTTGRNNYRAHVCVRNVFLLLHLLILVLPGLFVR